MARAMHRWKDENNSIYFFAAGGGGGERDSGGGFAGIVLGARGWPEQSD
jgi:hypothetical protein